MTVSNLANTSYLKNLKLTKHIEDKHVNINDDELMKRFTTEDNKTKLYSKFKSKRVAEEVVKQALIENANKIKVWDKNTKDDLKIRFNSESFIGYGFNKDGIKFDLSRITIILCKNKNQGFRIKSAFPC